MRDRETDSIILGAYRNGRRNLLEHEGKRLLGKYGVPVSIFELAQDIDVALGYAERIGYANGVVLKIVSPDIPHKTEAGGVKLDIRTPDELREKYNEIIRSARDYRHGAEISGVLVEEMLPEGKGEEEVIIGAKKDPQFGYTIIFGTGGIHTETYRDTSLRIMGRATKADLKEMIGDTKIGKELLRGFRGRRYDVDSIVDVLYNVTRLVADVPEIEELDINPLLVYPINGHDRIPVVCAVDVKIILSKGITENPVHRDQLSEAGG